MTHALPVSDASSPSLRVRGDGLMHEDFVVEAHYRGLLFGLELEFFTVDRGTLAPLDCLDALAAHPQFGALVKPEITHELVEIATPPSASLRDNEAAVVELCAELVPLLRRTGACFLPVALYDTVPFTLADSPWYRLLATTLGESFRTIAVTIASDQVNIGADDEAQAFRIYNAVVQFLPDLVAFSAASPFRFGEANGIASNRLVCLNRAHADFPCATEYPPALSSLADYARHLEKQAVFQHPSTAYDYARPMPHRGVAAEIRCLDKQPTIADSLALLALCKGWVRAAEDGALSREEDEAGEPPADRFLRARRDGLPDPAAGKELLDRVAEFLETSERDYLQPLYRSVEQGTPAARVRTAAQRHGVEGAYRQIAEEFEAPFA